MTEAAPPAAADPGQAPPPPRGRGAASPGLAVLIFGFGIAAGFLIAFSGLGFLQDGAAIVVTVFLAAICVVALLGLAVVAMRRPIWRRLFGVAETQVEMFAAPLARVAEGAVARDPAAATLAARELVQLALARYAWITARRWIIVALTGLIAAMAALAGTALLFRQNQLIEVQSALLAEQNARVSQQTVLLAQDVQLAEAARNAELAVEITEIAALVGAEAEAAQAASDAAGGPQGDPLDRLVAYIDPLTLPKSLLLRIVSASRAIRPYRFLDTGMRPEDDTDTARVAMLRRRGDLPGTYGRMAAAYGWPDPAGGPLADPLAENRLIDRPASPERGALLRVLLGGGLRELEVLNHFGLDLAFAYVPDAELTLLSAQGGRFAYADFGGSYVVGSDFGGARLENLRCRACTLQDTSFAAVTPDRARPPLRPEHAPYTTFMAGADFSAATLTDVDFSGAEMLAANFDGALLVRPRFAGASLGAATLRGAVLLAPDFAGAVLKSADFDGAIVFGDFLEDTAANAAPDTFLPDRYRAEPVPLAEVMAVHQVFVTLTEAEVTAINGGAPAYRLTRLVPFAD